MGMLAKETVEETFWRVELTVLISILVAVVPIIATALFGLWSYGRQKHVDRKIELRNLRMKGYEQYLTAFRANAALYDFSPFPADNDPARIKTVHKYWLAYSNLFQIASDSVLLAATDFHKFAWMQDTELTSEDNDQEFKRLYATMVTEMRRDAFEKTELQQKIIEERLTFDFTPASEAAKTSQGSN
jgi:hypothetical protein